LCLAWLPRSRPAAVGHRLAAREAGHRRRAVRRCSCTSQLNLRQLTDVSARKLHETCHESRSDGATDPPMALPRSRAVSRAELGHLVATAERSTGARYLHGDEVPLFLSADLFVRHPECRACSASRTPDSQATQSVSRRPRACRASPGPLAAVLSPPLAVATVGDPPLLIAPDGTGPRDTLHSARL